MGRPRQHLFVSFYSFSHCTVQLSINSAHHRGQLVENSTCQLPNNVIRHTLKMESACKPWVTFYYICGHVKERPVKHRKQCKAVHCHSLPPNIPPVDFPLEQSQPETRQCKQLELVVTISHSTCSRCLDKSTPSIAPISQPLLGERRTRWSNYQKEVQNICKEMADRRFKA
jgi:hypothetical protein